MTSMALGREHRALDVMNSLGFWITWTTLDRELKALMLWIGQGCKWHKWLWVMSIELQMPWIDQGCGWHEQLRSWAQHSRCNEQFRAMEDMNDSRSRRLWALDAMNNLRVWMTWMTLCCELNDLHDMNNSVLWMIWITRGHVLRALDSNNNSVLYW